jgi:hypothetical protein
VARAAGLTDAEVIRGQASFDDSAAVAGCAAPDPPCFAKVAEALGVDYVVIGTVTPAPGGTATASLKLYKDGTVSEHIVKLAGDLDAMVQTMAQDVPPLFTGARPPAAPTSPALAEPRPASPPMAPRPAPAPEPAPEPDGFARVGTTSWIIAGAGLAVTAASLIVFAQAKSKQDEVDQAPTRTPEELDRLVELEDQGERLTNIGNILLIGGAAALVTGGGLILWQRFSDGGDDDHKVSLSPIPLRGGMGVSLEVPLP